MTWCAPCRHCPGEALHPPATLPRYYATRTVQVTQVRRCAPCYWRPGESLRPPAEATRYGVCSICAWCMIYDVTWYMLRNYAHEGALYSCVIDENEYCVFSKTLKILQEMG